MKKLLFTTTAIAFNFPVAFENKDGWKKDADGNFVLSENGDPIWQKADGSEQAVQGSTISRLNGEAKTYREEKEAAIARLKDFEGIDAKAARDAFDKLSKIDQKKLIDAGEVEKVREEIGKGFQTQISEKDQAINTLQNQLNNLTLDNAFSTSKFIQEKVAVPPDMFAKTFKENFKVEGGKVVPYDASGNKVYSKKHMGEIADLDEAFEIIVQGYAYKDQILKADNHQGTGNNGGGGGRGAGRTIKRADFATLNPSQQQEASQLMQKGELNIVD